MEKEHVICSVDSLSSKSEATNCCYICSIVVKTKSNLKAHLIKTHKIVESASDEAFLRKKKSLLLRIFHCPVENCRYNISKNKGVNKFSILKQHYQWVHMPHNHICPSCNKTFGTAPALKYHEKKCGMRFTCEICSSDFAEEKFLTYHINRVHSKKKKVLSSDKATNAETLLQPNDLSPYIKVLQPIYVPIVMPMSTCNDPAVLASLQQSSEASLSLLHRFRLLRPETRDQACQVDPHWPLYKTEGYCGVCAPPLQYGWAPQPDRSFFDEEAHSRRIIYESQCHASMQTMPHHFDNFYNVETQTNLAGFVGRDFEGACGGLVGDDLISSFLYDPADPLKLADNHTQTASQYALDFVDLSDIETQTNMKELDDILFTD